MKKIILMFVIAIMALAILTGCGNMSMGLGNFEFSKIHIDTHHYVGCFTVQKWYESGTGIEVKTQEAGSIYVSEGSYILLDGSAECPFCKGE